jgi:hypothetical protein
MLLFFVETQWAQDKSIGSGTIIDPDGIILTCAHLVADTEEAVLSGKVINLALPVPLYVHLSYPFQIDSINTVGVCLRQMKLL